jgi:hypothetical protein
MYASNMWLMAAQQEPCEVRYVDRERVEAVLCSLASRATAIDVSDFFLGADSGNRNSRDDDQQRNDKKCCHTLHDVSFA